MTVLEDLRRETRGIAGPLLIHAFGVFLVFLLFAILQRSVNRGFGLSGLK